MLVLNGSSRIVADRRPLYLAITLLVVQLLSAGLAQAEECQNISITTEQDLNLGVLRAQPGARGFLELHPRYGLAATGHGLVHQGPVSVAIMSVSGPPDTSVRLHFQMHPRDDDQTNHLSLVELIVATPENEVRVAAEQAGVDLRMPERTNDSDTATLRIRVGGALRYRYLSGSTTLRYGITVRCE